MAYSAMVVRTTGSDIGILVGGVRDPLPEEAHVGGGPSVAVGSGEGGEVPGGDRRQEAPQ